MSERRSRDYWAYAGPFLFNPREASRIFFGKSRNWIVSLDGKITDREGYPWFPSRNEHGERYYSLDDIRTITLGLVKAIQLQGYQAEPIFDVIESMERLWDGRIPD